MLVFIIIIIILLCVYCGYFKQRKEFRPNAKYTARIGVRLNFWFILFFVDDSFRCCFFISGDELLSDSFPYKEIENGMLWEVEGKVGTAFFSIFLFCVHAGVRKRVR